MAAVEPFDGETGRLHLVHVEYKDSRSPVEERLLWELEPGCTLLEPTALPDAGNTDAMTPGDFDALGVCRIGRTGVGEGEQGCWGRRNNNLGNKPSWGSAWRQIWDRIRAANDSQRSVHGRRLSRA